MKTQLNKNEKQGLSDRSIPFPEEVLHLEKTLAQLEAALRSADENVEKYDTDYKESKKYLAEYRHEIDPKEIFQNELLLHDIERSGIIAVQTRDRLKRLMDSPYFSRIDFQEAGETDADIYYIGPFTFAKAHQILIFDWRAPVAGMFYESELGPSGYDAPIGRIAGELKRKRQFKIVRGKMVYALETAMNIRDDVLQRELSATTDEKMKTIIATLQKEQNQIIRDESGEVLIIQGVAGSGKTSIALHRIAYLLYQHRQTLTARNIVIISPNRVFGDYIANVLPELGEEPIYELSFGEIAEIQLDGGVSFTPDENPCELKDESWGERMRFKSSLDFIMMIDDYLGEVSNSIFVPDDYTFAEFTAEKEWIWKRYQAYCRYPVKRRLEEIGEDILEKFHGENYMSGELPKKAAIIRHLKQMLKIKDTLTLYKGFYQHIGRPDLFVMPGKGTLEWMDVYPFLYFQSFYTGLKENQIIRHLVIDEMQDYTPIQYEVINQLFKCKKTILGDFGQSINPENQNSLDIMAEIYSADRIVRLNKSYRSSYEIIVFAGRILPVSGLEPVERHGDEPELIECSDEKAELGQIRKKIASFKESSYVTMGILTKTNQEAFSLYQQLQGNTVNLITPDSKQFLKGVTVTSIQMAKGLEFDQVLIPFADGKNYQTEGDRKLLYIACTRAMHKLDLSYQGIRSPLL